MFAVLGAITLIAHIYNLNNIKSKTVQSGDQVEILTSKSQHVQEEWVNFVSSAKACIYRQ